MRRLARRTVAGAGLCGLLAGLYLAAEPDLYDRPFGHELFDRNGKLLRLTLAADERYRLFVPLAHFSNAMVEATLLYEDRWFFWHPGVNPAALVSAAWDTLVHGRRRGASTLTMQLARMRFGIDSRTISGKLWQIARAVELELYYSKEELLEAYLNLAPYGGNVEGVAAAARIYFDKDPGKLSVAEALALAVIPQKPGRRAPDADGNEPDDLKVARTRLAGSWLAEHPDATPETVGRESTLHMRKRDDLPRLAPHFVQTVSSRTPQSVASTTLDWGLQDLVERRARTFVQRHRDFGITNTAVLLVDHRSMEVLAALGSVDFDDVGIQGQVDGTRARRSPGSALKPFIYALALEQGLIHPRTLLQDAPMRFGAYNPENFDNDFVGPISATEALVRSRNVPAVFLETELRARFAATRPVAWWPAMPAGDEQTPGGLYDLLRRAGIRGLLPPEHYGLAVVLGGIEVSMEELVALYAMLANRGEYRPVRTLRDLPEPEAVSLLSPEAAYVTLRMLAEHERPDQGFSNTWTTSDTEVAWKTGTSYGFRDAWSVGVVGPYVLAVWVGNFDSRGNPAFVSRRAAAPLFFELVEALRPRLRGSPPSSRDGLHVAEVRVCAVSGMLPGPACPHTVPTLFVPGVSPITPCEVHRSVRVYADTGLRACPGDESSAAPRTFEFWPSSLDALFTRAGMPRQKPPAFDPRCGLNERAGRGASPVITSPQREVTYSLRALQSAAETVPFSATVDADVRELAWFVDDELVGRTRAGEVFMWHARPGRFVVRVLDDSGRDDAEELAVAMVE